MTVGSIAAGYPSFRPNQASQDKPMASSTENNGSASPAAFYPSPIYQVDPLAKVTVMEFRDPNTGTVTNQYPSAKVVEQYRRQRQAGISQADGAGKTSGATGSKAGTGETAGIGVPTASAMGTKSASVAATPTSAGVPGPQPVPPAISLGSAGSSRVSFHA